MLARSWGGMNGGPSPIERGRGQGISSTVVHRCRVERGVQSISRKSVCTARSPNAATLSSYSFDRNPLGLCTQSLMALFKDRYRSMETKSPEPPPPRSSSSEERRIFSRLQRTRERTETRRKFSRRREREIEGKSVKQITRQQTARCQKANIRAFWPRLARDRDGSGGGKHVIRITVDPLSSPDTCVSWNDTWPIPVTRFTSPVHGLSLSFHDSPRELFKRIVPSPFPPKPRYF